MEIMCGRVVSQEAAVHRCVCVGGGGGGGAIFGKAGYLLTDFEAVFPTGRPGNESGLSSSLYLVKRLPGFEALIPLCGLYPTGHTWTCL